MTRWPLPSLSTLTIPLNLPRAVMTSGPTCTMSVPGRRGGSCTLTVVQRRLHGPGLDHQLVPVHIEEDGEGVHVSCPLASYSGVIQMAATPSYSLNSL